MNDLPLHPLLVHLPIALSALVPLIAGGLLLAWFRGWLPRQAFLVATLLQLALVATGVAALKTGEADGERVERLVPEAALEAHEEAAETFVWAAGGVAVLFVVASLLGDRSAAKIVGGVATLGTVAVLGLGIQTGHAGGKLVYQHGAANAYLTSAPAGAIAPARADDD